LIDSKLKIRLVEFRDYISGPQIRSLYEYAFKFDYTDKKSESIPSDWQQGNLTINYKDSALTKFYFSKKWPEYP